MNFKRGVGSITAMKIKETGWKNVLASIAIKAKKQNGKHGLTSIGQSIY